MFRLRFYPEVVVKFVNQSKINRDRIFLKSLSGQPANCLT
jgi:hypothetical protein